jgi:hypothetical protein
MMEQFVVTFSLSLAQKFLHLSCCLLLVEDTVGQLQRLSSARMDLAV